MIELWHGDADCVVFLQTIEHVQDADAVLERIREQIGPRRRGLRVDAERAHARARGRRALRQPVARARVPRRRSSGRCASGTSASVDLLGLFHARKLRAHQWAIEHAGWDAIHARLGFTKPFYDRFTPAISVRDFALRRGEPRPRAGLPRRPAP